MMKHQSPGYLDTFKGALTDAIQAILGLTASAALDYVHYDWPTNAGSEKFTATPQTDVCYISVTQNNLGTTGQADVTYSAGDEGEVIEHTRLNIGITAHCILYGPHAGDRAMLLWQGIHGQDARKPLTAQNIAPVWRPTAVPTHAPELVNGEWYERYDVDLEFYMRVVLLRDLNAIGQAPDVALTTSI